MKEGEKKSSPRTPALRSSVVKLTVEADEAGDARLVLEGVYMVATGFKPGDVVEAIVQPELISVLRAE